MLVKLWSNWNARALLVEIAVGLATLGVSLAVSYSYYQYLPYDLAIQPLHIYPKEMKTYVYAKTCMCKIIAALFTIFPNRKCPKCLSTTELIDKFWCIHKIEYDSPVHRNKLFTHAATWMTLKRIMLS